MTTTQYDHCNTLSTTQSTHMHAMEANGVPLSPTSNLETPHLVDNLCGHFVVDASCGSSHSACITNKGALFTWGKGRYGRLGHNDNENHLKPKQVGHMTVT